jgi:spermidine/putrescine-binding protein
MNKKMLRIGTILFALVLVVSAFAGIGKALAAPGDLTAYSAADIAAFRWVAMAKFYEAQGVTPGYLTSLNAADRAAYRWSTLDRERLLSATSGAMSVDLTSYDAADISAYRWDAMAKFYVSQGLLNRNSSSQISTTANQQVNGERIYSWPGH